MLLKSYNSYIMKEIAKIPVITINVGLTLAKCLKVQSSWCNIKLLNPNVSIKTLKEVGTSYLTISLYDIPFCS